MLLLSFSYTLLFVALFGLIFWCRWHNSPKHRGKQGEVAVHKVLLQLPDEYCVMSDIVLTTKYGTTQIDHIVISKYGLFVIETKNYSGDIYGNDDRLEWTQVIATDVTYNRSWNTYTYITKNKFYNPVKQAIGHKFQLKKHLNECPHAKIIPIVVFTGSANISKVATKHHVIYVSDLLSTIESYRTAYVTEEDVFKIFELLIKNNIRKLVDNKAHIRSVRAAKYENDRKKAFGICPNCGGTLVLRTGKYGSFYGCSNYPQCKFTTHQ